MSAYDPPEGLSGRLITPEPSVFDDSPASEPVLWITDDLLDVEEAGRHWAGLLRRHHETGQWPLLLGARDRSGRPWHTGELNNPLAQGSAEAVDVEAYLAEEWTEAFNDAEPSPFEAWPGPAPAGEPGPDPDQWAVEVATSPSGIGDMLTWLDHGPYLGLVHARDGAEAVLASGWPADVIHEGLTAVLRTWQERYGVRLCSLGGASLNVTVAWPPRTLEHARRVAAEHHAFCPDLRQAFFDFEEYAESIVGAPVWSFWWD
ncbi:DUF4253 domain-containing protein [Actinomadura verrucosospora]|uniref:DUF4253 domain-containing protein n=1 Tax=Actinomadura verrucosospora TaxID=46165 RepID=A0A7D3ZLF7_ACTVE|nr:DUF4253 domain-containing protein [Actinomadura verrucosospora]QKG27137.1 hypothetical protein ACTIVE_8790 [Actinomadura verrucosospora]